MVTFAVFVLVPSSSATRVALNPARLSSKIAAVWVGRSSQIQDADRLTVSSCGDLASALAISSRPL